MTLTQPTSSLPKLRKHLTGRLGLRLVRLPFRVLVQLPIGVGKSVWMDKITVDALERREYDGVIVLLPTRKLIDERAPLHNPPDGIHVVNIRPRPRRRCGTTRNDKWLSYESTDSAALGREKICRVCPRRKGCFWPEQYRNLEGAQIIYATQKHLERSPSFIHQLQMWAGADRCLVLLDESNFIARPQDRAITKEHLEWFLALQRKVTSYASPYVCHIDTPFS